MNYILLFLQLCLTSWLYTQDIPTSAQEHIRLAQQYKEQEKFEACITHYLQAISCEPRNLTTAFELAIVYTLVGKTQEAVALYDRILERHPDCIAAIYNKGYALKMEGSCEAAITCYKKAIALDASYDAAHFALGMAYLSKGDFKQGWDQHARFLKQVDRNADKLRIFLNQGTTQGKTILLRPEGGLGDSINFIRYAQALKKYGIKTIVAVPKPLYALFKNCPGIDLLLLTGSPLPAFDDHTTLMSIPAILYSHEQALPSFKPYIFPDPHLVTKWGKYLEQDKNFKIGICWEASVHNDVSRPPVARRGIPLELLYILSEIEGVSLYSLQQCDGLDQLNQVPSYVKIHVFDDNFDKPDNFMDTAAVMQHMDLIISVDTAIAHLAGAMGLPIWLMLPYATDWRWIAHQTSSPWYPTMKIFQQPHPFDWQSAVNNIFWQLKEKVYHHTKTKESLCKQVAK